MSRPNLGGMQRKKLETTKIGSWLVLKQESSNRGMTRYLCRCECGTEKIVFAKHLLSGSSTKCKPCASLKGSKHKQWLGFGEISADWWGGHVGRSTTLHARKPIELIVTIEEAWNLFLTQNRKCALSGVDLYFPIKNSEKGTASLDRIDSFKGYALGNIQWVHKDVNKMKNAFDVKYFIDICKKIASNSNLKE